MSYQAALDFIKAGRDRGYSDADITGRLRGVGWQNVDIQDAFALLASMGRMPSPVAKLASMPVVAEQPTEPTTPEPKPSPEPELQPEQPSPVSVRPTRSTSLQRVMWIALVLGAFVLGYVIV